MLSKSFKFAACWAEGAWGWRGAEVAVPIDLSAPWGSRGTLLAEALASWMSTVCLTTHTNTRNFWSHRQGTRGAFCWGLPADTKQPGSHRPALVSGCHSSKTALRRSFIEKFVPSLYSYLHLLCLPSTTEELRAPTSSQVPSAQMLQHKIIKGIAFLARSSPPSPQFQSPCLLSKRKAFSFWVVIAKKPMQPVRGRDVRGEAVEQGEESLFTTGLLAVRDYEMQLGGEVPLHNQSKQQCFF